MNWVNYWAWKCLFPSRRRFTFFTFMSIVGVTLGVAVIVVVQSVMNGFQDDIKRNLVAAQGEIRVEGRQIIPDCEQFTLRRYKEVSAAAPFVHGMVMLTHGDCTSFAYAKGVDRSELEVTEICKIGPDGSSFVPRDNEIILGINVAHRLGAKIGDVIEVYAPNSLECLTRDEVIFPKELTVIGFSESNNYLYDVAICSLAAMQSLYATNDGVHGVTLRLNHGISVEKFAYVLQKNLGDRYIVTDWIHSNHDFLFALRWEKTMMFFVLFFVLLVSLFSISSMLITNVVRKTREIGTLVAMGGNNKSIALSFCFQSVFIGILGITFGIISSVIVLEWRDKIIAALYKLLPWSDAQSYLSQFTHLPVSYKITDFLLISVFTLTICIFCGLIPALKVSRIQPANALRYER